MAEETVVGGGDRNIFGDRVATKFLGSWVAKIFLGGEANLCLVGVAKIFWEVACQNILGFGWPKFLRDEVAKYFGVGGKNFGWVPNVFGDGAEKSFWKVGWQNILGIVWQKVLGAGVAKMFGGRNGNLFEVG